MNDISHSHYVTLMMLDFNTEDCPNCGARGHMRLSPLNYSVGCCACHTDRGVQIHPSEQKLVWHTAEPDPVWSGHPVTPDPERMSELTRNMLAEEFPRYST